MPSPNVELVKSLYAEWQRGNFGSAEWADPEIEFISAGGPAPGTWTGLRGMTEGWRDFLNAWEGFGIEAEEYLELDDERVLALVRLSGRGKTSGLELEQMGTKAAALFHIRAGKVTRLVFYWTREALADVDEAPEASEPEPGGRDDGEDGRREVSVSIGDGFVATVEIHRPPDNHVDIALVSALADAYEALDDDPACRAIVLCSEGKHFCAGVAFGQGMGDASGEQLRSGGFYGEAVRLFAAATPVVAAVQGAAVGGGLGLALSADFRVASPESRFWANFARLGFHHGFGMTVTLPALVGQQAALDLLYTARRVRGEEAKSLGLCDRLVPSERIRDEAHALAAEIAASAPLAVRSIRKTLRGDLAERVRAATEGEQSEQVRLMQTDDFPEGLRAMAERRGPNFRGR
jgi:2-(1,2-epoxy-1,2-dihydrophenyl)acetyl-CoA isomerase